MLPITPAGDPAVPPGCPSCAQAEFGRSITHYLEEVAPRMPNPATLVRWHRAMLDFHAQQIALLE